MAPKYSYKLTNGKSLELEGDEQPSDEEVESIAAEQGVQLEAVDTPVPPIQPRADFSNVRSGSSVQEEEPSFLGKLYSGIMDAPEFITKPARQFSDYITTPELDDSRFTAMAKGFVGGATEGAASLLSPANIATLGRGRIPTLISQALGAGQGMHGVGEISEGNYTSGLTDIAMGMLGLSARPNLPDMPIKPPGKINDISQLMMAPDVVPPRVDPLGDGEIGGVPVHGPAMRDFLNDEVPQMGKVQRIAPEEGIEFSPFTGESVTARVGDPNVINVPPLKPAGLTDIVGNDKNRFDTLVEKAQTEGLTDAEIAEFDLLANKPEVNVPTKSNFARQVEDEISPWTGERQGLLESETGAIGRNINQSKLDDSLNQVLSRMDSKGESLDEAIEAVTGTGKGDFADTLRKYARGESTRPNLLKDETGSVGINQPVKPSGPVKPKFRLDRETGAGIPIDEAGNQIGPAVFPGKALRPDIAAKSKYAKALNEAEVKEPGMARQIYDLTRGLMSVDAPFGTSAAFRQAAPLVGTKNWFKAWVTATKSFGKETSYDLAMDKIKQKPLFQPKQVPVGLNKDGSVKYQAGKSYADEVGLATTDLGKISRREEMIRSQLAEKIPIYGNYIRASNRAYTAFLNQIRADQLETLVASAKAAGKDPTHDLVLGKQIADIINDQTGRGKLGTTIAGKEINLEHGAKLLTDVLWSPRLMASRIRMLYPEEYLRADPFVRKEYFKSMGRMIGGWGAFAAGFQLSGVGSINTDPNNSDFGKVKVGNTRYDPGAGFLQYMVYTHRMLPQIETWEKMGIPRNEITERILGGGGTTPSTGGKFKPFGEGFKPSTRFSTSVDFALSKIHPTLGLGKDVLSATKDTPFNVYDKTIQAVLPMFITGMAEMYNDEPDVFKSIFGGMAGGMTGLGTQTYKKGEFDKPAITPFLDKVLGTDIQKNDIQLGR